LVTQSSSLRNSIEEMAQQKRQLDGDGQPAVAAPPAEARKTAVQCSFRKSLPTSTTPSSIQRAAATFPSGLQSEEEQHPAQAAGKHSHKEETAGQTVAIRVHASTINTSAPVLPVILAPSTAAAASGPAKDPSPSTADALRMAAQVLQFCSRTLVHHQHLQQQQQHATPSRAGGMEKCGKKCEQPMPA
jgi:hypothetical protein